MTKTASEPQSPLKKRNKSIRFISDAAPFDWPFFILVIILLTIGIIMMFSASYAYAYYKYNKDSLFFVSKQISWAIVGVIGMLAVSFVNYRVLRVVWPFILGISYLCLIVVLLMPAVQDVHRWIIIGESFNFQPSEIAKFTIVLVFAHLIALFGDKMQTFKYGVLPFLLILASIAVLVFLEPHLSATILIAAIGIIMMIVGGTRFRWFIILIIIGIGVILFVLLVMNKMEYAVKRIEVWLNPFSDPRGDAWQIIQSLYAIASGGLMGVGLGNSRQKFLYISEPQNDFVFAVVAEELGFIGAAIIIVLFALLIWRGFVIAMRSPDRFGSFLALGLTCQVALQVLLNIAVVTNTVPNTGISLPFFSYGGSSLVMLLLQMGLVLGISRGAKTQKQ